MPEYNFQGWIAALSDGTHVVEEANVPGELSCWQKLLKRCNDEHIVITGMRLWRGGIMFHALPQKQCTGYFQAYEASKMMFRSTEGLRQGIGSIVDDKVYVTWITDKGYVFQDVRELKELIIHTTLRYFHENT